MSEKRKRVTYSKEFKMNVVKAYLDGQGGYDILARDFGIHHSMVMKWVRVYRVDGETGLEERRGKGSKGRPRKRPYTPDEEILRLRAEVDLLKKLLELGRGSALDD
jgi:transposase